MTSLRQVLSFRIKDLKSRARGFCLKAFGSKARGVSVETPWGLMLVDPRDGHVSRQLLRSGVYNPEEVDFLRSLLRPNDRMLIVGGHIGGLAIPLSKSVASVDVVEASPSNFRLLKANVALAGAQNMTCHHWAASETSGELKFLMSPENSGGSKRSPAHLKQQYQYDKPALVTVPAYPLDQKLSDSFDVIVMDIEGSEFFAIQGGKALISSCRVFVFEFIPDHIQNVAGVTLAEFLEVLPVAGFSKVIFPRQQREVDISELHRELERIFQANDYEDGVVLIRD